MVNIFENSYFGKSYKTRDGRKAIYIGESTIDKGAVLIVYEDSLSTHRIMKDGHYWATPNIESGNDIVSVWQEEPFGNTSNAKLKFGDAKLLIDEEELDELAWNFADKAPMSGVTFDGWDTPLWTENDIANAFKAGYIKALEQ